MSEKIKKYQDLQIWQKAIELVQKVYSITETFPDHEKYNLVSQLRRSAVSIPSNIAEGFRRFQNKEYKQFLYVSLGSIAELETQLTISCKLSYFQEKALGAALEETDVLARMINSLVKKL